MPEQFIPEYEPSWGSYVDDRATTIPPMNGNILKFSNAIERRKPIPKKPKKSLLCLFGEWLALHT